MKKRFNRETLSDCLFLAGCAAISVGAWIIHVAAGLIVGGIFAIAVGWLISRGDET